MEAESQAPEPEQIPAGSEPAPGTPVSVRAERGARMTPAEAVRDMRINLPARGNRKLRDLIERVNRDESLKALWHAANVNAVTRLQINDHSWVHIQIVTNIGLKLLRELRRAGVEPGMVTDYGMEFEDAEVVTVLGCLTHCLGMAIHRSNHEEMSLFLAADRIPDAARGRVRRARSGRSSPPRCCRRSSATAPTASRCRSRPAWCASPTPWTWPRAARGSRSRPAASRSTRCPPPPIEAVNIRSSGTGKVLVEIVLNNSAGLFQVDNLLQVEAPRIRPGIPHRGRGGHRGRDREAPARRLPLGSE